MTGSISKLIIAAYVAPMDGPVLKNAGIVVRNGFIVAIDSIQGLRRKHPEAQVYDAGQAVILPGLINAHTHLELSSLTPGKPPKRFVDWIIELMGRADPAKVADAVGSGIDQCLRFGITTVGDITSQPVVTRPLLSASPLRGVSFGEVRGMAQRRSFVAPRVATAIHELNSPRLKPGISPHAPYSIEMDGYKTCLEIARKQNLPLATHLAETSQESEFLNDQTGPFKELWDLLNAWDDQVPRFAGGPICFAQQIGLLAYPTLLAHVNYCDDTEMDLLAGGSASVVYCPRTHAFFNHPPHRWQEMIARGINVSLGTDSCASSVDLNLVDDLRLVHGISPHIQPLELWKLITVNAAKSLSMPDAGSLTAGHVADLSIFPVTGQDPLLEILETGVEPSQVWIGGDRVR